MSTQTLPPGGDERSRAPHGRVRMLFLALEGARPLGGSTRHSLVGTDEVVIGRGEHRSWKRTLVDGRRILQVTIADSSMSTLHARLVIAANSVQVEDLGSKNGTLVNGHAISSATLASEDVLELGSSFFSFVDIADCDLRDAMRLDLDTPSDVLGMATLMPAFRMRLDQLRKIAPSIASVIVHGESGTGKELIARAIHEISERKGPFVAVNCAAITDSLLESEFFGHVRGAFSGAGADRKGLIETSSGGTLFLDEIGELSAKGQASLLRVLEQQEVMPVGASRPLAVDLRVVAATHRNLLEAIERDLFREDLYARLSTFVMEIPPLRQRIPEIGSVVASLLSAIGADSGRVVFSPTAGRRLLQHRWPRNIRELQKCLRAAVLLADHQHIELEHLGGLAGAIAEKARSASGLSDEDERLRAQLIELLQAEGGNVSRVGETLGKKRQQVQKWCKRLDIDPKHYR